VTDSLALCLLSEHTWAGIRNWNRVYTGEPEVDCACTVVLSWRVLICIEVPG